jgi:hypothetical protein
MVIIPPFKNDIGVVVPNGWATVVCSEIGKEVFESECVVKISLLDQSTIVTLSSVINASHSNI